MEPRRSQNGKPRQLRTSALQNPGGWALAAAAVAALFRPTRRYHPRQVALVTGRMRGLELALAHRFGQTGLRLVLSGTRQADLEAARTELLAHNSIQRKEDALLVPSDPTSAEPSQTLIGAALQAFERIDLVICDSRTPEFCTVEAETPEAYEDTFARCLHPTLSVIQAAVPHLLEPAHGDESSRGIVLITSPKQTGLEPKLRPYIAAQVALSAYTKGLRNGLRGSGVQITSVQSGLFPTDDHRSAADRIYKAAQTGRPEVNLIRQPWLGSRFVGDTPQARPSQVQNGTALDPS